MNKLIALTGLKGSGKDTTADYIIKNYYNWEKDSFAGTLKDAVSAIFGWDRKMLAGETVGDRNEREQVDEYWSKKLGYDVTPRNMLQRFGTDILRCNLHKAIWVDSLERKIVNSSKNIIITDCRFKNELDMIREIGGTVIRIERNPLPEWFKKVAELNLKGCNMPVIFNLVPEVANIHISELDWIGYDKPDFIFHALSGDFNHLYNQINKMMEDING